MNKKGESKFPRGIGRIEELIRIVEGSADPAAPTTSGNWPG